MYRVVNTRDCLNPDCTNEKEGVFRWCEVCNRTLNTEDRWYLIGLVEGDGYPYDNCDHERAYEMGKADREEAV